MPTREPISPHHGPIEHRVLKSIQYASLGVAAFSLVPFILPMVGIGGQAASGAALLCSSAAATSAGVAGGIAATLGHIPLIGGALAAGGLPAVAIAAGVGIGGLLLGNYLEKKGVEFYGVNVGKIVRWTALATSMLFALPMIIGGITMSLHFLSQLLSFPPFMTNHIVNGDVVMGGITNTLFYQDGANAAIGASLSGAADALGSVAAPSMNGILGTLTTLATCCVPVGVLAWMTGGETEKPQSRITTPVLERMRAAMQPSQQVARLA